MSIKVFVLGSCYSGYMFKEKLLGKLACGSIKMVYQHQHDSLISIMTPQVKKDLAGATSKYQWDFDHFAESIFNKDVIDKITELQPDYIVFDTYAEAVCPIVRTDTDTFVTANYYIQDSSIYDELKDHEILWPSNPERKILFEKYAPAFFSLIREKLPDTRIILVRAKAACELFDKEKKELKNFTYADKVEDTNRKRQEYDEQVMSYVPDIRVLNMLDEYGVADTAIHEDYDYEISHNHYETEYYRRQYTKLQSLIISDLLKDNTPTKYFNQAICMIAGEDVGMLLFLARVYKDFFRVYIQIDANLIGNVYTTKDIERLRAIPNVYVLTKYKAPKGSYHELLAILQMAEMAFSAPGVKYVHFTTGNDVPIRPVNIIYRFFDENEGYSYLNLHANGKREEMDKVSEYTYRQYYYLYDADEKDSSVKAMIEDSILKQKNEGVFRKGIGEYTDTYKGVVGGSLTREAYEYCRDYVRKHPEYLEDIKYTRLRSEFFFQTILMNDPDFREKIRGGIRGGKHDWNWDEKAKDYAELTIEGYKKIKEKKEIFFVRKVSSDNEDVLNSIYSDIKTPYRIQK
ncbi:MAG: DUF6270 domain-containing protein [Lachnospiraceae bacterium]|nr:DUF6270 domain-containing protein [Lachnospiraceae bacterium]